MDGDGGRARYTMAEAARRKGVSYDTVSRAVRRGVLAVERAGRLVLIPAAALEAWTPMAERARRSYPRRSPAPVAPTALLGLATGDRVELVRRVSALLLELHAAADAGLPGGFPALLCARVAEALDFCRVALWGIDWERGVASRLGSYGPPMSTLPSELPLAEIPLFLRYAETGATDAPDAASFGPQPRAAALHRVTTLFVTPLRAPGGAVGVLLADRGGEPFALTPAQLALTEAVAAHAAQALHRALRAPADAP